MRILVTATGSRGDVQPFLVLAEALQQAGHEVITVAPIDYEPIAQQLNIPYAPIQGNMQALLEGEQGKKMLNSSNPFTLLKGTRELIAPVLDETLKTIIENADGIELVISHISGVMFIHSIAEKLGIPLIPVMLVPLIETGDHPSILFPPLPVNWRWINRATGKLVVRAIWMLLSSSVNTMRAEKLGLPAIKFNDYSRALWQMPMLLAYSSHVLPRASDWPDRIVETGFWYLDSDEPTPELEAFLKNGEAPIYFGFGSMNTDDPKATGQLILQALDQAARNLGKKELRAILMRGWSGLNVEDVPPNVLVVDAAPHHYVFPGCAAIVHHGGVGTTAAALRAGVPNLVVPFMADQPYWGKRIADMGLGPSPIPRKKLTAGKLAAALTIMLSDQQMQAKTHRVGVQLQQETGIAKAVEAIEQISHN